MSDLFRWHSDLGSLSTENIAELAHRSTSTDALVRERVAAIVQRVRANGDLALSRARRRARRRIARVSLRSARGVASSAGEPRRNRSAVARTRRLEHRGRASRFRAACSRARGRVRDHRRAPAGPARLGRRLCARGARGVSQQCAHGCNPRASRRRAAHHSLLATGSGRRAIPDRSRSRGARGRARGVRTRWRGSDRGDGVWNAIDCARAAHRWTGQRVRRRGEAPAVRHHGNRFAGGSERAARDRG